MELLHPARFLAVVVGIFLILACVGLWVSQDFPSYDEIQPQSSGDILFTEQGNYVAELGVRPFPGSEVSRMVPVQVFFNVNHSRFHGDAVTVRIIRQDQGDIYFKGYPKERGALVWSGNDGYSGIMNLQTPGFLGESSQVAEFLIPLNNDHETIIVDVDARLSETGPLWRHSRIRYQEQVAYNRTTG